MCVIIYLFIKSVCYCLLLSITNYFVTFDETVLHTCETNNILYNSCISKQITRITRVKYIVLVVDWNLRWSICISDLVMNLRSATFKIYKLNKILPKEFMCTVYNALNKSIFNVA